MNEEFLKSLNKQIKKSISKGKKLTEQEKKKEEFFLKRLKENKEKRLTYEKKKKSEGYIKYENNWLTPKQYEYQKKIDKFINSRRKTNNYKGLFCECIDCNQIWTIRKDFGMPSKCGSCNSKNLTIEKRKSYKKFFK